MRIHSVETVRLGLCIPVLAVVLAAGCAHTEKESSTAARQDVNTAQAALKTLKARYAPAGQFGVFSVGLDTAERSLTLTGMVDQAEARVAAVKAVEQAGVRAKDHIEVVPADDLGDRTWGIACLSVASGREQPEHKAEMGTQVLMGDSFRVLRGTSNKIWFQVQTRYGYIAWLEKGTFTRCTKEQVDAWDKSPLLIVTTFEDVIYKEPNPASPPVSDVVIADLVAKVGENGEWDEVRLPDGRQGFLRRKSTEDYASWQKSRQATAENIEVTARRFLGRPYLWGANSPKGLDCSGFAKLVFHLNGVELRRNANQQVGNGVEVPLDENLSQLKPGDLIFFGRRGRNGEPPRVSHVGIYLGNKLFIHSSELVQINSLDPNSPIKDEHRIRTLVAARRVLPAGN